MTIGSEIALHSLASRRKYGRYPVPEKAVPLPGHEDDEIPSFPDTSEKALRTKPLNRADDRQRFKIYRIINYTKDMHRSFRDRRKVS